MGLNCPYIPVSLLLPQFPLGCASRGIPLVFWLVYTVLTMHLQKIKDDLR